jgi:hypothetical protein
MVALIPYGLLANGNYGILVNNSTGKPLAAAIEVLGSLPSVGDSDNFAGRAVYNSTDNHLYMFEMVPTPGWHSVQGAPVTVGAVAGAPPSSPTPDTGSLYYDTDTEVLFLWDGLTWQRVGGQYSGQLISYSGTGDGASTSLPMGLTAPTATEDVEVFLDGIRQTPSSDYNVVGSNVVLTTAPALNVKILARALVLSSVAQNSQITQVSYTGNGSTTSYITGQAGVNPNGIFVYLNGVLKTYGTDYTITQDNTQISSITHVASSTTATITTVASAHGLVPGQPVTIAGVNSAYFNITTLIQTVPTANTFTITVSSSAPATGSISAATGQVMYFSPAANLDRVVFSVAPVLNAKVVIVVLKNVIVGPAVGEANTAFNLGTPSSTVAGLFDSKVSTTLNFKSLEAGSGISFDTISDPDTVKISTTSGMSQHIRVAVTGGGGTYDITSNAPTATLIGVRNAALGWTISLPTPVVGLDGRRIVIKDESGVAGSTNITINVSGGGALLEGSTSKLISTNYGGYTFYCDGAAWYIEK